MSNRAPFQSPLFVPPTRNVVRTFQDPTPFLIPPPLRYKPNVKHYPPNATPEQCGAIDAEYHARRSGTLIPPPLRYTPNVKHYPPNATPKQCGAIDAEYHARRTAEDIARKECHQ